MNDRMKVVLELTWDEARALAYASHGGLIHGRFPDEDYRALATAAREKLLVATREIEREVSRG